MVMKSSESDPNKLTQRGATSVVGTAITDAIPATTGGTHGRRSFDNHCITSAKAIAGGVGGGIIEACGYWSLRKGQTFSWIS
jgi:hypothetical protein